MIMDIGAAGGRDFPPSRREILKTTTAFVAAAGAVSASAAAQPYGAANQPKRNVTSPSGSLQHKKMVGYMLAHEQFTVSELVNIGGWAKQAGFDLLATSDHLQPWQANEGHCGAAWVTLAAAGERTNPAWIGTTVTCPTLRYNPAVVAEAFASLSLLYPGRVFLGVGSGEALNEEAATGVWPKWPERWERLVEAIGIIRALWNGEQVAHHGKYYNVEAKLYDPPPQPIPLLTAANGRKSMRLAGQHGDGLITDPRSWRQYKSEWEGGRQRRRKKSRRHAGSGRAICRGRRSRRGAASGRILALSAKGLQKVLQHRGPGRNSAAGRQRGAARTNSRRMAGRNRSRHPYRGDQQTVRERRDNRQRPLGATRPKESHRILCELCLAES